MEGEKLAKSLDWTDLLAKRREPGTREMGSLALEEWGPALKRALILEGKGLTGSEQPQACRS